MESNVAEIATRLMAAWESGDRFLLEAALEDAAKELGDAAQSSPFHDEIRELLQGVVQRLNSILLIAPTSDFRHGRPGEICYHLLRHAQGMATDACISQLQTHTRWVN